MSHSIVAAPAPKETRLGPTELLIEAVVPSALTPQLRTEWDELFDAQSGVANPFCAPEWVLGWYETFTAPRDRVLLFVRSSGVLVGVAPFFRDNVTVKGIKVAGRLQLVGSGQGGSLLELPQILSAPGQERAVLRIVVAETLLNDEYSGRNGWAEVAVSRAQGWFEGEWVARTGRPVAFFRQQISRACVVIPLAGSWESTKTTLKRNVKESLRRSKNRIAKDGRPWSVVRHTTTIDDSVVDRFFDLHQSRAEQEAAVQHGDAFADPRRRHLLRSILPELGRKGRATIFELWLGGRVVASQLVLHAPGLSYIHSSGFSADVWELGPVTHLQGEAISQAADRGEQWVNMSPGPNVAKLRWSERIDAHDDFAYGCGGRGLQVRYGAFAALQGVSQARHAVALNQTVHEPAALSPGR